MDYQFIHIYTKTTNLMEYYLHNGDVNCHESAKEYYEKEREVQLQVMVRYVPADYQHRSRFMCKIKCPINPLPVKGEFEVPNLAVLRRFLEANGWKHKETFDLAKLVK